MTWLWREWRYLKRLDDIRECSEGNPSVQRDLTTFSTSRSSSDWWIHPLRRTSTAIATLNQIERECQLRETLFLLLFYVVITITRPWSFSVDNNYYVVTWLMSQRGIRTGLVDWHRTWLYIYDQILSYVMSHWILGQGFVRLGALRPYPSIPL